MRVLVTGARGFIGRALCQALRAGGSEVIGTSREQVVEPNQHWLPVAPDFEAIEAIWPQRIDAVVHLAARVHQMNDTSDDALAAYRRSNRDATLRLARAAAAHQVSRFVFLSSIKALGEIEPGHPFSEADLAAPLDAYGISKSEAEHGLALLATPQFRPTILRVPLVYGPGVRANFASLAQAVARGWPLPLGQAVAERSLLGLDNLVAALLLCLDHADAPGQTFHLADAAPVSVRALVLAMAAAMHRQARLFDVPPALLLGIGTMLGRRAQVERLVQPLRVDSRRAGEVLGWSASVPLSEGLARMLRQPLA